jgi:DNA mismatch endonuclease (patch repair protein)
MVFTTARVVVFIDGDFWHGWHFPKWYKRLSPYWYEKIARNRRRDQANFRQLRRAGWRVIRIWEHEVKRNVDACVDRIQHGLGRDYESRKKVRLRARSNRGSSLKSK